MVGVSISISIWELNSYKWEGNLTYANGKVRVLLLKWKHCTRDRKFVALGHFLEVKPNKRERLVRTVTLKTRFAVLKRSIGEIVLLEAPRLDESS